MACRTWEQYERYILQQWPLTRREVQVALECIKGRKNKEIASVLGIGAETVNKTLDHVYRAIGVNGRDQLVAKLLIADIYNSPLFLPGMQLHWWASALWSAFMNREARESAPDLFVLPCRQNEMGMAPN